MGAREGRRPGGRHNRCCLVWLLAAAFGCGGLIAPAAQATAALADLSLTPLRPAVIVADGAATATATVHLSDASGNPITGDSANLRPSSDDPGVQFGAVQEVGHGDYAITAISSTTAHRVVITVTDSGMALTGSQPLQLVPGPVHSVDVSLVAGSLTAVTDGGHGVYRATITAANRAGMATIRATDVTSTPSPSGSASLTLTRAPSLLSATVLRWTFLYTPSYTSVGSLLPTSPLAARCRWSAWAAAARCAPPGSQCPSCRGAPSTRRVPAARVRASS